MQLEVKQLRRERIALADPPAPRLAICGSFIGETARVLVRRIHMQLSSRSHDSVRRDIVGVEAGHERSRTFASNRRTAPVFSSISLSLGRPADH